MIENAPPGLQKIAANLEVDCNRYLPIVISGIEGNIFNSNLDMYPWSELLPQTREGKTASSSDDSYYGYLTWVGKPVCRQHQPQLGKFGYVVDAYPRPDCLDVPMLLAIDRQADKVLCEKIASGEQRDFSMGCLVQYVRCSFCGKKSASGPNEFCEHLSRNRGTWLHCKEGMEHNASAINGDYVRVGEVCYGIRGQEMSAVHKGAFASSKTLEVLQEKSASASVVVPTAVKLAVQTLTDFISSSCDYR